MSGGGLRTRTLLGSTISGGLVACIACGGGESDAPTVRGDATLYVLFDERHGLEGGERVLAHDFEIGVVDEVELFHGRVRAKLSLSSQDLANLSRQTTFTVESSDDGRVLVAYRLADDEVPLRDGDLLEGSDSAIELAARGARAAASGIVEDLADSELWGESATRLEDMKRELDALDWSDEERELRKEWNEAREHLDEALTEGYESAAEAVEALARQLERAGRSEQAERLRRRFHELSSKTQR